MFSIVFFLITFLSLILNACVNVYKDLSDFLPICVGTYPYFCTPKYTHI